MENTSEKNYQAGDLAVPDSERAAKAGAFYSRLLHKRGVELFTLSDLSAWKEYVNGRISDPDLDRKARVEIDNLDLAFGKYLVTEDGRSSSVGKDPVKRARAKLANRIYKRVCEERNVNFCFFNNFKSWSEYVGGIIGESEFYQRAEEEVERMIPGQNETEVA